MNGPSNTADSARSTSVTDTLASVSRQVETRLVAFFDDIAVAAPGPLFDTVADSILLAQVRDLTLRAGKRLRAALVVAGAALFDPGMRTEPATIDGAAAMELRQTYLLIHDDIMDGDTTRRGGPTVHVALSGYTGDRRLGEGLGILAGDLAQALEQVLLTGMDIDESRLKRVLSIFAAMHLDVVHGQALDMLNQAPSYEVATHKTASYTTVGPLCAGAALAGAREKDLRHLARISLPLGVAFQFRDDLLGTFGAPKVTGKPSDTDLKEGKKTVLLEEARSRADKFQLKQIERVLGRRDASDEDVDAAREALVKCGAKAACERHIQDLVGEFTAGLDQPYYDRETRQFLVDLAHFIAGRNV